MNIYEFQNKHSNLILEFEEINLGKNAIWNYGFTRTFLNYLKQKNIIITYKPPKTLIPNRYNYLPYISEFWLKFLQDHTYFGKRRVTEDYISEYTPPKDKCVSIRKEFRSILRHLLKYGIIEHHSRDAYKINKEKVEIYSKNH